MSRQIVFSVLWVANQVLRTTALKAEFLSCFLASMLFQFLSEQQEEGYWSNLHTNNLRHFSCLSNFIGLAQGEGEIVK